jgi:hypothetical protein
MQHNRHSSIDKIRAELAWVTETPDPNNAAVAIFDAARELDIGRELAPVLSRRSSGPSDGNTTVRHAVNANAAEVRLGAI